LTIRFNFLKNQTEKIK